MLLVFIENLECVTYAVNQKVIHNFSYREDIWIGIKNIILVRLCTINKISMGVAYSRDVRTLANLVEF